MNSAFTPKKHSCLKEGVTRQQLIDTLEQIKTLKNRTSTQIQDYERTIQQQSEQICYLTNRLERIDNDIDEAQKEKEREMNLLIGKLSNKEGENSQLKQQLNNAGSALSDANKSIQNLHVHLKQSQAQCANLNGEIESLKQRIAHLNSLLNLNCFSESDIEALTPVKEQGGIRGLIEHYKQERLTALEEKHILNEKIRNLEFQLHKIDNQRVFDDKVIAIKAKEVSGLQQTIKSLRDTLSSTQNRHIMIEKELSGRDLIIENLKLQLEEQEGKTNIAQREKDKLEEDNESLRQALAHNERTIKQQQTQIIRRQQYWQLVESTVQEWQDMQKINDKIQELNRYRSQYYRNVDKVQYLCGLLDTGSS